jgi:hypothetical protein
MDLIDIVCSLKVSVVLTEQELKRNCKNCEDFTDRKAWFKTRDQFCSDSMYVSFLQQNTV